MGTVSSCGVGREAPMCASMTALTSHGSRMVYECSVTPLSGRRLTGCLRSVSPCRQGRRSIHSGDRRAESRSPTATGPEALKAVTTLQYIGNVVLLFSLERPASLATARQPSLVTAHFLGNATRLQMSRALWSQHERLTFLCAFLLKSTSVLPPSLAMLRVYTRLVLF
ncbi:hypothetical protein NDU88_000900 [Pleurodeles waltl]|uniref:Uncharacterized protein n=1 Tax=Pleurodeles waltl TaxID=8319 RepID=A0AAV7TIL9_PLEWA|nr:hypothetical protein NDU88_000900 [Pleurodeles waltl]